MLSSPSDSCGVCCSVMRLSLHAIDLCVCLSALVIPVGVGFSTLPSLTCSSETAGGVSVPCSLSGRYKEACKFQDRQNVDRRASSTSFSGLEAEEEEKEKISVKERPLNSANSVIDISFPLLHTKRAVVVVAGRSVRWWDHRQQRCVVVTVTTSGLGQVTLRDLTLPHGSYQVWVMKRRNLTEDQVTRGGLMKDVVTVMQQQFVVPIKHRQERVRIRSRRHKNTMPRPYGGQEALPAGDLILQDVGRGEHRFEEDVTERGGTIAHSSPNNISDDDEGSDGIRGPCICCKCYNFVLDYEEENAILSFSYHLNDSCDAACSTVNVQLYRDGESHSDSQCSREKPQLLLNAQRIGQDKNVTESPIKYSNVDAGCYFVELKPHLYRLPERTPSFWVTPAINVTNMENWTTYFSLEPSPERRSLTVRWTVSKPYNFSSYHLTLYHHPSIRINCTGKGIYPNMSIIPQERLIVKQPLYAFYNLSSGWYCARVTPLDDRCPLDGCQVLSSPPEQLTDPVQHRCQNGEGDDAECGSSSTLGLTLLVVGCVVGAVVTGVTVAWGILHSWPSLSQVFTSATHYSPVPIRPTVKTSGGRRPIVLLVWTPQGPHGAKFGPIIAAFKTILHTYSHCEVYDYLDLSSLPERQQLHLLASPTTWLDSILAQHSIKVIIVATEGAWQRQVEWKQSVPSPHKDDQNHLPAPHRTHDQLLFPYLLRRLHDQPDLAGDYSRVFHIRFSDVSHSAVELGNVVSWKRYKIPEHLQSLTASLHGGVGVAGIEEPSEDQLKELRAALSLHPQHCSHVSNGNGPPWPSLTTYSSLSPVALTNGSTKT